MTDPACRATLDVLTAVEEPAHFTDENLRCLVVARMANLSLEHGNSDGSCVAYVHLGWFLGPRFGDYQAAFRFAKLGLDLVEKHGLERFRARVSQCFGYFVNPRSRHLRTGLGLLRRSFATAQEAGDLKYAVYSCDRLVTVLLAAGDPLGNVQREAENGLEFVRKAKFGYIADIIVGQLRLIRTLRGLTPSFSSFNDAEFDEARFEQHLETDPALVFATCWYWIRKLQARFHAGDYVSAIAAAAKAKPLVQARPVHFELAEWVYYNALARAAHYEMASAEERLQHLEALGAYRKQLDVWAENCPENFGNRAALVGAEIARIEGRELSAQRLYEKAIRSAHENGFAQVRTLAREKELGQLRSKFVSMVSHEFRTPLGIIQSSAEILEDYLDQLEPAERKDHLLSIRSNTGRMARARTGLRTMPFSGRAAYRKLRCGKDGIQAQCAGPADIRAKPRGRCPGGNFSAMSGGIVSLRSAC